MPLQPRGSTTSRRLSQESGGGRKLSSSSPGRSSADEEPRAARLNRNSRSFDQDDTAARPIMRSPSGHASSGGLRRSSRSDVFQEELQTRSGGEESLSSSRRSSAFKPTSAYYDNLLAGAHVDGHSSSSHRRSSIGSQMDRSLGPGLNLADTTPKKSLSRPSSLMVADDQETRNNHRDTNTDSSPSVDTSGAREDNHGPTLHRPVPRRR